MKRTLRNFKSAQTLSAKFLLCGMFTMVLPACKTAPKFPEIYPRVPFHEFGTCVEYKLIDHKTMQIEPTGRQFPIAECTEHFCLTPEDQVKVNDWTRDMYEWADSKCEGALWLKRK